MPENTLIPATSGPMVSVLEQAHPAPETTDEAPEAGQPDPGQLVPVRWGDQVGTVPYETYHSALQNGATPLTDEEWQQHQEDLVQQAALKKRREQYGDPGHQLEAAAVGAASGLSLGLSDAALRAVTSKETMEGIRQSVAENPWSHGGGQALGMLAPLALSGGAAAPEEAAALGAEGATSAAVRGAASAAEGTETAQVAARAATTPPGILARAGQVISAPQHLVTSVGERVERGIASLLPKEATTLSGQLATKAAIMGGRMGAEGAIYGASDYLSEQSLSKDPQLDGEKLLASVGVGSLLGGVGGGLFGAGGVLAHEAIDAVAPKLKSLAADTAMSIGMEGRNASAAKDLQALDKEAKAAGFKNGKEMVGDLLLKENLVKMGQRAVDAQPAVNQAFRSSSEKLAAMLPADMRAATYRDVYDSIETEINRLEIEPHKNAAQIAELKGVQGDFASRAANDTKETLAAKANEAVEASGSVKRARAAENSEIAARENAAQAVKAAEARETKTAKEAKLANDRLETAQITRAQRAQELEALKPMSPEAFAAFKETPEGHAAMTAFLQKGGREPIRAEDLFPKAKPELVTKAKRAAQVAEAEELRAASKVDRTMRHAEEARIAKATRQAEADAFHARVQQATSLREAAETAASEAKNLHEKTIMDTPLSFKTLGDMRKSIDADIKWNALDPNGMAKNAAKKHIRNVLEDKILSSMDEKVASGEMPKAWTEAYKAEKFRNRKLRVADKAFTKAAASHLKNNKFSLTGYIAGAGIGHVAAGPAGLGAGLAGMLAHKVVKERGGSTAAVLLDKLSAMGAITKASESVDKQIDEGIRGIFGHGPVPPKSPPSHGLNTFEEKRDAVLAAMKDPAAHQARLEQAVSSIAPHAPGVAASFQSAALRTLTYLANELPKEQTTTPMMPHVNPLPVSEHDKHVYNRKFDAANDPLSVMHDVAKGIAVHDQIEAMNNSGMPALAAHIGKKTVTYMQETPKAVSYKQLTGASTLLGGAVSPNLQNVGAWQTTFAPQQAPNMGTPAKSNRSKAPGAAGGGHKDRAHLASQMATGPEKIALG